MLCTHRKPVRVSASRIDKARYASGRAGRNENGGGFSWFLIALTLVFCLLAQTALAAPTITASNSTSGTNDLTFSIAVATGDTLYVVCTWDDGVKTVAVTHNGDAVSEIQTEPHASVNLSGSIYRLLSPDVGTFNVVANISVSDDIACVAMAIAGVDQSTPETNTASSESAVAGTSLSSDISCPAGNLALDVTGNGTAVTNLNPTGGQSEVVADITQGSMVLGTSTLAGAGTTTLSWGWTSSGSWVHLRTCIMAAAVAGTPAGPLRRRGQ